MFRSILTMFSPHCVYIPDKKQLRGKVLTEGLILGCHHDGKGVRECHDLAYFCSSRIVGHLVHS